VKKRCGMAMRRFWAKEKDISGGFTGFEVQFQIAFDDDGTEDEHFDLTKALFVADSRAAREDWYTAFDSILGEAYDATHNKEGKRLIAEIAEMIHCDPNLVSAYDLNIMRWIDGEQIDDLEDSIREDNLPY
jgi:hypothetical protein